MKFPLNHTVITKIAEISKVAKDNEKFLIEALAFKAKKIVEANPYDQTAISMANFLSKKMGKVALINRKELNELYQVSYTPGNKFAEYFENELGIEKKAERKLAGELPKEEVKAPKSVLADALESVLNKTPLKGFSELAGKSACHNLSYELKKIAQPKEIDAVVGNNSFIICRASYDTPKGSLGVLFPLKLASENQAQFPTTFVAEEGLVDLNKENLSKHIISQAGKKLDAKADVLLAYLTKKANENEPALNDLQFAVAKLKMANSQNQVYNNTGITYKEAFPKVSYIQDRKVEVPEALKPFAEKLGSQIGGAEFIFGKSAVDGAREFVLNNLSKAGYKEASVKLTNFDSDQVVFAVSFLNRGFRVPVKIAKDNNGIKIPQSPKFFIVNNSVKKFAAAEIADVLSSPDIDATAAYDGSAYSDRSVGELDQILRVAISNGSTDIIQNVLSVLQVKSNASFRVGLDLYKQSLLPGDRLQKIAAQQSGCSKPARSPHYSGFVCSHTGLPTNKVYQNKFGACLPLYRKELEERAPEPVPVMTDKLFWK